MLPFSVDFKPGLAVFEQVVYAATKAIVGGRLRQGDAFPSVRQMAQELKINPNTAHKVVSVLVAEGLLEVLPGRGTVVASGFQPSRRQRRRLLEELTEELVVEARKLALSLDEVQNAVEEHWSKLKQSREKTAAKAGVSDAEHSRTAR